MPMAYNNEHMVWYHRITQRHINRWSARYDVLVRVFTWVGLGCVLCYLTKSIFVCHRFFFFLFNYMISYILWQDDVSVNIYQMFPPSHPASQEAYWDLKIVQSLNWLSPNQERNASVSTHTTQPTHLVLPHTTQPTHPVSLHLTEHAHLVTPASSHFTHPVIPNSAYLI